MSRMPEIDPVSYAAHTIDRAIDDLLIEAQRLASVPDAARLDAVACELCERLEVVAGLARLHSDPWGRPSVVIRVRGE